MPINQRYPFLRKTIHFLNSVGSPTDVAILRCIEDLFGSLIDFQKLHPKVYEIPFNSVNKFQLSIHESAEGYRIVMKG